MLPNTGIQSTTPMIAGVIIVLGLIIIVGGIIASKRRKNQLNANEDTEPTKEIVENESNENEATDDKVNENE